MDSLFSPMYLTLFILALASFFFMQGKVRSDLVAVCALLCLMFFKILSPEEALAGFSNSVVIMMVGLFVVGAGIFRTGLAKMISSRILRLAGNNENLLFFLVMLVTASIGAFVSNTGTVAVMMPIVVSMAASANLNPSRYLMPLAFASSMGLFTLISTPPNLVIQDVLTHGGYKPLSFFSFAPVGLICLVVGGIGMFFLSKYLVDTKTDGATNSTKKGKTLQELVDEYRLNHQAFRFKIPKDTPLLNQSLAELKIATNYGITVTKITRKTSASGFGKKYLEIMATPNSLILHGDVVYCNGSEENIHRFATENGLTIEEDKEGTFSDFQESGIAEVFVMPNSKLINHTIREARFREEYNVSVLGIKRQTTYQRDDFQNIKLHSGDALLIQGTWKDIAEIGNLQDDLVLLGQPLKEAAKVTLDQKAPIAALIMLAMVVAMVTNVIPTVTAVLVASVLMVVTGCLRNMEEAYNSINWETVVLIAAMLPMATAFKNTGAASLISNGLIHQLGPFGPYALLAGVYFSTSLLTLFISNTATAVLFAPIALNAAQGMGVSPYPFLFAVAIAASLCFASPFSTPPNALVMQAGRYSFMDYVRIGTPLQIIMGIVFVFLLPLLFPF